MTTTTRDDYRDALKRLVAAAGLELDATHDERDVGAMRAGWRRVDRAYDEAMAAAYRAQDECEPPPRLRWLESAINDATEKR